MQFNFVVSINDRAVRLWELMGFEVVGGCRGRSSIRRRGLWMRW